MSGFARTLRSYMFVGRQTAIKGGPEHKDCSD